MQYLCLIYEDETHLPTRSEDDQKAIMGDYFAFTGRVRESGKLVAGDALMPTHTATTVRVRDGNAVTSDGPFAETKEQLGGYYLLECNDLDEAIELAGQIPSAKWGSIEVRPIMVFDQN
jgi:hypothetical protein